MNDVETNPGPANMDSRPDSRYTPQQKEVIARRKETSRALREIKQRKGDTTQRTVIHEMWEIHCLEKKDELSQLIQNPTLPVKPTETHRSPHRVPGDMWEMLSRLDAPLEDEDAVRRLKPEIQQGEWFHLIRIIPQLKNQNWINHQKSYQKHQLRHNRRPEMNDVETNPGPYSPQQLEFIKRQKPVFQALEEINKRKGIQQEATIHQVISLQQKDQEIQTIQDSSSYSQPKETKKNFYKNISKEMWTKLANLDAPLNNWRAVNRLFPLLQNRENSAIRREVAIARFNLRHNSRPDMNDVEMNPGPVQAILKILVILTCCLTTQTSGQIISFGENYAQSQKGLSSQICLVQRKANNTQLRKYITGETSFWMKSASQIIYIPKNAPFKKPSNKDIICASCTNQEKRCPTDDKLQPSEWIISTIKARCNITYTIGNKKHTYGINVNPNSDNLHRVTTVENKYRIFLPYKVIQEIPNQIQIECKDHQKLSLEHTLLQIDVILHQSSAIWKKDNTSNHFRIKPHLELHNKEVEISKDKKIWNCKQGTNTRTIQKNEETLYGKLYLMKAVQQSTHAYVLKQRRHHHLSRYEISNALQTVINAQRSDQHFKQCYDKCRNYCTYVSGTHKKLCARGRKIIELTPREINGKPAPSDLRYYIEDTKLNYESDGIYLYDPYHGIKLERPKQIYAILQHVLTTDTHYRLITKYRVILNSDTTVQLGGINTHIYEGLKPKLSIKNRPAMERAVRSIYRWHNIELTDKETNQLISKWFKTIQKSNNNMLTIDAGCATNLPNKNAYLIEIRRDDIIIHYQPIKGIITSKMGCANHVPDITVLSNDAPVIAQYIEIDDQTLLLAEILPFYPPKHQRFLTPTKQDYPIRLLQEHMVSINNQLDVVYQYQRDHHLVTASGKLLWMKQDEKSTLKEMNLTQHYEQYRALSYSNLNNQINLARQAQSNQREIRVGNVLKTVLPDVTILQQCNPSRCKVLPERHIYGIPTSFIPVLCSEDPEQIIMHVTFNEQNFKKMIKLHAQLYQSTDAEKRETFKEKLANQSYKILTQLHNKTHLSLQYVKDNSKLLQSAQDYHLIQIEFSSQVLQLDPENRVVKDRNSYKIKEVTSLHYGEYLYLYHGYLTTRQLWNTTQHIPDYQFQEYRKISLEYDSRAGDSNLVYLFEHEQMLQKTLSHFIIETRQHFRILDAKVMSIQGQIIDLRKEIKDLRKYVDKKFKEEDSSSLGKFFNKLGKGFEDLGKGAGRFVNKVLDKGVGVINKVIETGERIIDKGIDAAHDVADSALDIIKLPLMILAGTIGAGIIAYFIFKVYKDQPRQLDSSEEPAIRMLPQEINQIRELTQIIPPSSFQKIYRYQSSLSRFIKGVVR